MIFPVHTDKTFMSHCLLNETYGILKRAIDKHPSARQLQMLHQMVTDTDSPAVSLLYPEANIFPSIFWQGLDRKNLGALTSFFINAQGRQNSLCSTPASPNEHINVRLRDGDLATSHDLNYLHGAFDIKLNNKMNHQSATLVFRRGLEFLAEDKSLFSNAIETPMEFEELDSTRKVKELAALIKKAYLVIFFDVHM